jgi:hypothetical protein
MRAAAALTLALAWTVACGGGGSGRGPADAVVVPARDAEDGGLRDAGGGRDTGGRADTAARDGAPDAAPDPPDPSDAGGGTDAPTPPDAGSPADLPARPEDGAALDAAADAGAARDAGPPETADPGVHVLLAGDRLAPGVDLLAAQGACPGARAEPRAGAFVLDHPATSPSSAMVFVPVGPEGEPFAALAEGPWRSLRVTARCEPADGGVQVALVSEALAATGDETLLGLAARVTLPCTAGFETALVPLADLLERPAFPPPVPAGRGRVASLAIVASGASARSVHVSGLALLAEDAPPAPERWLPPLPDPCEEGAAAPGCGGLPVLVRGAAGYALAAPAGGAAPDVLPFVWGQDSAHGPWFEARPLCGAPCPAGGAALGPGAFFVRNEWFLPPPLPEERWTAVWWTPGAALADPAEAARRALPLPPGVRSLRARLAGREGATVELHATEPGGARHAVTVTLGGAAPIEACLPLAGGETTLAVVAALAVVGRQPDGGAAYGAHELCFDALWYADAPCE